MSESTKLHMHIDPNPGRLLFQFFTLKAICINIGGKLDSIASGKTDNVDEEALATVLAEMGEFCMALYKSAAGDIPATEKALDKAETADFIGLISKGMALLGEGAMTDLALSARQYEEHMQGVVDKRAGEMMEKADTETAAIMAGLSKAGRT